MAQAAGVSVELAYTIQTSDETLGGTPLDFNTAVGSPSMKRVPSVSRAINARRNEVVSQEVLAHRQTSQSRHGSERTEGSPGFELAPNDFDEIIGWGFQSDWVANTATTGTGTIGAATATSKFTGTGLFSTFKVGDKVTATGFSAAVDGVYVVIAQAANEITVWPTIPADVTGNADELIVKSGADLKFGTSIIPAMFERRFTDIGQYQGFLGCFPSSMQLGLSPDQNPTLSMPLLGTRSLGMSGTPLDASPAAAGASTKFDVLTGAIVVNGVGMGLVTGLNFTANLGNQLGANVIGSRYAPGGFVGQIGVTGTITAFLEDATLVNYFQNETEISVDTLIKTSVTGTAFHGIYMPRVKVNGGDIDPGQTGPVIVNMPFRALYDETELTTIRYQRSNS